jgi:hypothetical protein
MGLWTRSRRACDWAVEVGLITAAMVSFWVWPDAETRAQAGT